MGWARNGLLVIGGCLAPRSTWGYAGSALFDWKDGSVKASVISPPPAVVSSAEARKVQCAHTHIHTTAKRQAVDREQSVQCCCKPEQLYAEAHHAMFFFSCNIDRGQRGVRFTFVHYHVNIIRTEKVVFSILLLEH